MTSFRINICLVLMIMVLPVTINADTSSDTILVKLINNYFSEKLDINATDLSVSLIRVPELTAADMKFDDFRIEGAYSKMRLGRQTLWLLRETGNRLVKRYPVTAEVFAEIAVPVAAKRIGRSSIIEHNDVKWERRRVGRDYHQILQSDESPLGHLTTQLIPAGQVFRRNMLRPKPDVMSGEPLDVTLTKGALSVVLNGVAKEDGIIGEEIRIQCSGVNKVLMGTLLNSNKVSISLK